MIYAFATSFGMGTNNQAELQAAIFGVHWCLQHWYNKIILEVDSELLMKWLTLRIKPPWQIQEYTSELQNLTSQLEFFKCIHTYREANYTADALSKWSHQFDIPQHYYVVQQLPKEARGYYNMDKLNMANFRRKKLKRIKKPPWRFCPDCIGIEISILLLSLFPFQLGYVFYKL